MTKNIVIIGGSAGGATVGVNLRRYDEGSNITIIEKGPDISYANCSLPYYFSGEVENIEDLIVNRPEDLKSVHNIDVLTDTEVIEIDRDAKTVVGKNLKTGEERDFDYDKLIMSPGADPIISNELKGDNVFTFRNVGDVRKIDRYIESTDPKSVCIIGNGYIGIEVAEAMKSSGLDVTLVGSRDQVLPVVDYDTAQNVHRELIDNGVNLVLGSRGSSIEGNSLTLENKEEVEADFFIVAIGVRSNTTLAKEAGLELGETGAIKVNQYQQTNDHDIYAIGDATESSNKLTGDEMVLQLAFPAHRQADIAAGHIYGEKIENYPVIGSSTIRVFDLVVGSTGLTQSQLEKMDIEYEVAYRSMTEPPLGERRSSHIKILFSKDGKLLGGQVTGKHDITDKINILATMIFLGGTVEDLEANERPYMPFYSNTKDITNVIGGNGREILNKTYRQATFKEMEDIIRKKEYILDTRSEERYEKSHIIGGVNIPFVELRNRIEEVPRDRTIYTNSYNTYKLLRNLGYDVVDLPGNLEDIYTYFYHRVVSGDIDPVIK